MFEIAAVERVEEIQKLRIKARPARVQVGLGDILVPRVRHDHFDLFVISMVNETNDVFLLDGRAPMSFRPRRQRTLAFLRAEALFDSKKIFGARRHEHLRRPVRQRGDAFVYFILALLLRSQLPSTRFVARSNF